MSQKWYERNHQLLIKWGLPERTTRAYTPTLCNRKPCGVETRNKKVTDNGSYYHIGIELKMNGQGQYILDTWTIYDNKHVMNSHCTVDANGKLVEGKENKVNCFSLGWLEADQEWMTILIDEMANSLADPQHPTKWLDIEKAEIDYERLAEQYSDDDVKVKEDDVDLTDERDPPFEGDETDRISSTAEDDRGQFDAFDSRLEAVHDPTYKTK